MPTKKPNKPLPLLYVEWLDSNGYHGGWINIKSVKRHHDESLICYSVGWLVKESKNAITIVSDVSHSLHKPKSSNNYITIPKVAITRRHIIRNPDGRK